MMMASVIHASILIIIIIIGLVNSVLSQSQSQSQRNSTSTPSSSEAAASSAAAAPSVVTASGSAHATHIVTVGKVLNQFDPDSLTAAVGDVIQFAFFPPNHSVGRAEYQQPCIPYEDTGEKKVGFWSGFFPLNKVLPNPPTWNLTVNDTEPIFFYCAAPGSCINFQMVGVINPNDSVSLAIQKNDASNAQYMLAPGEPFPSEAGVPSGDVNPGSNANAASSPSSSAHATTTSAAWASPTPSESSHKLSTGAIVGIVIGGVVVLALIGALFFLLGRQKTMLQFMRRSQYHPPGPRHPPGDQRDIASPPPHMSSFANNGSGIFYTDSANNYHEPAYDTPPYKRHAAQDPLAAVQPPVAELPSPGEKHLQEYISSNPTEMEQQQHPEKPYQVSRASTPQPRARPLSFWGRSKSIKTQTSELSAESPTVGKSPEMSSSRFQPTR